MVDMEKYAYIYLDLRAEIEDGFWEQTFEELWFKSHDVAYKEVLDEIRDKVRSFKEQDEQ